MSAGGPDHRAARRFRNQVFLIRGQVSERKKYRLPQFGGARFQVQEIEDQATKNVRRTLVFDLRIAPDDDGIRVMPGVAPAPETAALPVAPPRGARATT